MLNLKVLITGYSKDMSEYDLMRHVKVRRTIQTKAMSWSLRILLLSLALFALVFDRRLLLLVPAVWAYDLRQLHLRTHKTPEERKQAIRRRIEGV